MNVFVGRDFVCHLDNSKWCEENGHIPYADQGYNQHVCDYWAHLEMEELNGKTKVRS